MSLNVFVPCLSVLYIGRTARAGASGVALSLVSPSELGLVATIQKAQEEKLRKEGKCLSYEEEQHLLLREKARVRKEKQDAKAALLATGAEKAKLQRIRSGELDLNATEGAGVGEAEVKKSTRGLASASAQKSQSKGIKKLKTCSALVAGSKD